MTEGDRPVKRRAWMQALTSPMYLKLGKPFSAEFDGRTWDAAGTGPALLMLATAEPTFAPGGPDLSALDKPRRDCGDVDIDSVRDWAFTPEEDWYCSECGGGADTPVNHARMGGVLINRALLFRFIPPGAHGNARLHASEDRIGSILLDGGDWRLYLMCMDATEPIDAPEWPNG